MAIMGHKTESMWQRYSIIETADLHAGLGKGVAFRSGEASREASIA